MADKTVLDRNLALEVVRVTEAAALSAWLSAQDLNPASIACAGSVKRLASKVAQAAPVKSSASTPAPPPSAEDEVPVPAKPKGS